MTVSEMTKKLDAIDREKIKTLSINAVLQNSDIVISDAIVSNIEGKTFAGNDIKKNPPFTDWEQTGEFHENLKFRDNLNIEFTSRGDGFEAISEAFPYEDAIGPSAKILSEEAKNDIQKSLVEQIKEMI